MADYIDLYNVRSNDELRNRIAVAVSISAQQQLASSPSANAAKWATRALRNPLAEAGTVINAVLAANNTATISQILNATDSAIQTNVDAVVTGLITAEG